MSNEYNDNDIVIVDGYRTPVGKLNGCFKTLSASQLGSTVIKKLMEECHLKSENVSEVIMGQSITAGQGQNPARQSSVGGGLDYSVPASGVSFLCGSGLKSVMNGYQAIKCGDADLIIAGGQESMTNAPHCVNMRQGINFGDGKLVDSLLCDGLVDVFNSYHMGVTAENVAKQWNISREEQDRFAEESQRKIKEAQQNSYFFNEIVPVTVTSKKETITVVKDEFPTPETTYEGLSRLRPVFIKDGTGTVTAGNSSGINDGAAAVVICRMSHAKKLSLKTPVCRIAAFAQVGVDPSIMGIAPVYAVRKVLEKANWLLDDVELFELNEAFAAQSVAVIKELNVPIGKVNICGGSIGIGHPIGASGCRILVTLIHNMRRLNKRKGVAALCVGGGMGIAVCVERL